MPRVGHSPSTSGNLSDSITRIVPEGRSSEEPLTSPEREVADRLAERLHSELQAVLHTLPKETRTASGLARFLGVERTGCQRMMSALAAPHPDANLLTRLPGIATLRSILDHAERKSGSGEAIAAARTAVDLLAEYFDRAGGGQAVFARRLLISTGGGSGDHGEAEGNAVRDDNELLFEAARRSIGRWSALQLQTAIYCPAPDAPNGMQTARMRGFIGHEFTANAPPLVLLSRKITVSGDPTSHAEYEALDRTQQGEGPIYAAPPFCSDPPARITSRRGSGVMVQVVDPPDGAQTSAFDFVTADRSVHAVPLPTTESPPIHEIWVSPDYPAASLLFDVWQHRDLARCCIPSLSAHLYRINVMETPGDRWYTKLADGPKLQLLGTGLDQAASPLWSRQHEALAWMFQQLGWDPGEFVGYRCEVRYPLWRIGYLMSFDFSGAVPRAGA